MPLPAAPRGSAARHQRPAASCLAWAGSRYRSFDGRHFHFQGECAYSLAASADGTWAVTIAMGSPQVPATPGAARHGELSTGGWRGGLGSAMGCNPGGRGFHPRFVPRYPWLLGPCCAPLVPLLTASVPQVLRMTFGLDAVVARGRNVSVNGVGVPEGQPHLHGGEGQRVLLSPWGTAGDLVPCGRGATCSGAPPGPFPVPVPC